MYSDDQTDISKLRHKVMTDLNPDLRDLTRYCKFLRLAEHDNFQPPDEVSSQVTEDRCASLARYTDQALLHAIVQVFEFKEIESPLVGQKDTSLRSMSRILSSLASKALVRSSSTGNYVHLTDIFFESFAPNSAASKSTFYGYKNALIRYALKRVSDLLLYLPPNVAKEEVTKGFLSMISADKDRPVRHPSDVDNAVDIQTTNVDNSQPHKLTKILMEIDQHEIVEKDPKLSVYPWFAKRRHRTSQGVLPMLTKAEVVDLVECARFICYYPPDLKFERRGIAGKKRAREFVFDEAFNDGLLLNAPKPSFLKKSTSKRAFDRSNADTKMDIARRSKRLASTIFEPSHFWLDVEARIKDQSTKQVIATQLITGCRPSELVDGVIVSTEASDEKGSLGRLHFTIFGTKTKVPSGGATTDRTGQIDNYLQFLETSSVARNSKIRGQFFHIEVHEVFPQFPERVWLYTQLTNRQSKAVARDSSSTISFLLEKVAHFKRQPRPAAVRTDAVELSSTDRRMIVRNLQERTGKTEITEEDIAQDVSSRNLLADIRNSGTPSASHTENFESFVSDEINKMKKAWRLKDVRLVSPYQAARTVRFRFMPNETSFPLMSRIDGIPFFPSNVDNSAVERALPRLFLLNEFDEGDLDQMGVPEHHRHQISSETFAELQKERASYLASAVVQLGKRYKTASESGVIEPTPYVARHKLLSDLKGLIDEFGAPLLSREDIARKAGHASTASQTGYGKAAFSEKGSKNRGQGLKNIKSSSDVKNPKATAGKRHFVAHQNGSKPPEPRYAPKD